LYIIIIDARLFWQYFWTQKAKNNAKSHISHFLKHHSRSDDHV
jgi:hypothetical protein